MRHERNQVALLPDRGVVSVAGAGRREAAARRDHQRHGVCWRRRPAIHAGLLTPQGKILFDFFVVQAPDGFLLDTARDKAASLAKRLTMYKLRADVDIADVSADYTVAAHLGRRACSRRRKAPRRCRFADPRLPRHGLARARRPCARDWALGAEDASSATQDDYHAHRIALGVPEGGKDYAFGDTFPHEALFDR